MIVSTSHFVEVLAEAAQPGGRTRADRIRALQEQARQLASEQVMALEQALALVAQVSHEIIEGAEAYPAGIREIARRLADDAPWSLQTLETLRRRNLPDLGDDEVLDTLRDSAAWEQLPAPQAQAA
jgi:hypothetical protein